MIENLQCRAFLSVMGSFLITMGVGLMYLWGIISIYTTSYYRIVTNDTTFTEQKADIVFPLQLLGQAISIPIAARMFRKSSPRFVCMICGAVMSATLYMSSYSGNYSTFAGMYGLIAGIAIGFIYIYPIAHCYTFFPHRKSTVSGFIISASGIGTMIFAFMAYMTINPTNQPINPALGYFGNDIAMKFPIFIRNLSILLLLLISGGGLLLFDVPVGIKIESKKKGSGKQQNQQMKYLLQEFQVPAEQTQQGPKNPFGNMNYEMTFISKGFDNQKMYTNKQERQYWPSINEVQPEKQPQVKKQDQTVDDNKSNDQIQNKNECSRVRDGPKQPIFWAIFFCILFSVDFGLLMSCNYKSIMKFTFNDKFLTLIGAFGALACGLSRFLLAALIERFSFRFLLWMLLAVNSFLAFTIYYIREIMVVYPVYVILTSICYGGFLGIFPAISSKIFGFRYGSQIYGFLFYAFPASNFTQNLLFGLIQKVFGLWFMFMACGGMSIVGLLMSNRITTIEYDWSHRIRENNERKRMMAR